MRPCVARIENHQHRFCHPDQRPHLVKHGGITAVALNQGAVFCNQRMFRQPGAVGTLQILFDADHPAVSCCGAQGGIECLPAAFAHTGFQNHIRLCLPDQLLQAHKIIAGLEHRQPSPAEGIGIARIPPRLEPQFRQQAERRWAVQWQVSFLAVGGA